MSESIYIVGCGGHGKVVSEVVNAQGGYTIAGFLEPAPDRDTFLGCPVFPQADFLNKSMGDRFAVAIGENDVRRTAVTWIRQMARNARFPVISHPSAVVSQTACLGEGTVIMPRVVVNADAQIGSFAVLNSASVVEHDCVMGDFISLAPGAVVCGGCTIGESVYIGAGATVIHDREIGPHAVVGAGSVMVDDLGQGEVALGVPAKPALIRKPGERILKSRHEETRHEETRHEEI